MTHTHLGGLRRLIGYLAVALLTGLGLLGSAVSLFPPDGAQVGALEGLIGLAFSAIFFFSAWVVWRWVNSCLLCREGPLRDAGGCETPAAGPSRRPPHG